MIRRIIKYVAAVILYYSGLLALLNRMKGHRTECPDLLILMYHRVLGKTDPQHRYTQPELSVSPEMFDKQVTFLKEHYTVMSLSGLVQLLRNNHPLPAHTVVITFDDGWRDNYVYAFQILKKHDVPATIFLATDFIESNKLFWFLRAGILREEGCLTASSIQDAINSLSDTCSDLVSVLGQTEVEVESAEEGFDRFLERLKWLEPEVIDLVIDEIGRAGGINWKEWSSKGWTLTWDEVREMYPEVVEFGSHGCSHGIMTRLSADVLTRELTESRRIIENQLGTEITHLAYPNGDYSDEVKRRVWEAGYRAAITVGPRDKGETVDLYSLPRVGVHDGMSAGLLGKFSRALLAFELRR